LIFMPKRNSYVYKVSDDWTKSYLTECIFPYAVKQLNRQASLLGRMIGAYTKKNLEMKKCLAQGTLKNERKGNLVKIDFASDIAKEEAMLQGELQRALKELSEEEEKVRKSELLFQKYFKTFNYY